MSGEFKPGGEAEPEKGGKLDIMGRLAKMQLYFTMVGELEGNAEMQALKEKSQKSPEIVQQSEIEEKAKEILSQKLEPFTQRISENGLTVDQAYDSIIEGYIKVAYPSNIAVESDRLN
jgi:hypothetical protein